MARYATFLESENITREKSGSGVSLEEISEVMNELDQGQTSSLEPKVIPNTQEPRRTGRVRQVPERYGFLVT